MSYLYLDFSKIEEFKTSDDGDIIFFDAAGNQIDFVPGFNSINFFVGQNNSGKSKFLRGILKSPRYIIATNNVLVLLSLAIEHTEKLEKVIITHGYASSTHIQHQHIPSKFSVIAKIQDGTITNIVTQIKTNLINLKEKFLHVNSEWFNTSIDFLKAYFEFLLYSIEKNTGVHAQYFSYKENNFIYSYNDYLKRTLESYSENIKDIARIIDQLSMSALYYSIPPKKIFIPTLRSTHSLYKGYTNPSKLETDLFADSIIVNYKFDISKHLGEQNITIHTGLNLYTEIKETRAGHSHEQDLHLAFEKFIREHFFPMYDTVTISSVDKNESTKRHITVRFGTGKDRDIHYLGDGINSLINILYPIFTCPNESWIFIEEPEVFLHPGMQRIFVQALLSNDYLKKKKLVYFITTHSNHLLDIGAGENKVSINTFSKIKDNHHAVVNVKSQDISILTLLGAQNSSVYLANCTLWVEGITDRIYLNTYLKCYVQHLSQKTQRLRFFDEDLHYSYFLYGGSNIVHYLFKEKGEKIDIEQDLELQKIRAYFLSNRIMLIADKDKGKDARHEVFVKQQNPKFKFETLKVREVENLLSAEFLQKHLHLVLKSVPQKSIEMLALSAINLKTQYLGKCILSRAKSVNVKMPKSFADKSGTVNSTTYKKLLAETAKEYMTWDLMTKEAQDLAKKVYDFIKSNNE